MILIFSILLSTITLILALHVTNLILLFGFVVIYAALLSGILYCYLLMGHRFLDKADLYNSQNNDYFSVLHNGL